MKSMKKTLIFQQSQPFHATDNTTVDPKMTDENTSKTMRSYRVLDCQIMLKSIHS